MSESYSLLIGGVQGEGLVSIGLNLMKTLSSLGFYTYGSRTFSSRIKGGNSSFQITIGTQKQLCAQDTVDSLLALDLETINLFGGQLKEGGMLLYDANLSPSFSEDPTFTCIPLPITNIAKEAGALHMKNTCAIGFIGRLLGLSQDNLITAIKARYGKKGAEVVEKNLQVLSTTFEFKCDPIDQYTHPLESKSRSITRPLLIGNEAIGLGALMAGCRFISAYPITPASEVMEYLGSVLPQYGGAMVQVEDEIAAVTMAIGASYAGVRSMTASSGPGLSLMLEGLSLSGMTEVPVVVAACQRVGPSTGLPTKHEQSDLFTLYYGGHGEYPSIILAPSTVEECFYDTIRAFNLAEEYQCPVIILSDLSLSLFPQTIDTLDYDQVVIRRGAMVSSDPSNLDTTHDFNRFAFTESGISPRSIPGMKNFSHHITGVEHNESGLPDDKEENRQKMMEKRLRKTLPLSLQSEVHIVHNHKKSCLFLTMGSNFGIVKKAVELSGNQVDYGVIRMIRPLPRKQLLEVFEKYDRVVILENNYEGQLASIIQQEIGYHHKIDRLLQYNGRPFTLESIIDKIGGEA